MSRIYEAMQKAALEQSAAPAMAIALSPPGSEPAHERELKNEAPVLTNGNSNGGGAGPVSSWVRSLRRRLTNPKQDLMPFRRLALRIHSDLPRGEASRSALLVTPTVSAVGVHGSTVLGCCLAEELGHSVLLVDGCTRNPQLTHILDCTKHRGFIDLLSDPELVLDDVVLPTSRKNVFFLPAGGNLDGTLASPESMSELLKAAERRYDFVLLSGGSVLDDATALALAPSVGCVLLFVVEAQTKVTDLGSAEDALESCKARKVGVVLTTSVRSKGKAYPSFVSGDALFRVDK